jgi:hypothetical protein
VTYAAGIDVGTTFSAAATWRDGRAATVALGDRAATVPSVLFLRDDGIMLGAWPCSTTARSSPRAPAPAAPATRRARRPRCGWPPRTPSTGGAPWARPRAASAPAGDQAVRGLARAGPATVAVGADGEAAAGWPVQIAR